MKKFYYLVLMFLLSVVLISCGNEKREDKDKDPVKDEIHYTVSFNTNGGSEIDKMKVLELKTISMPSDPIKDNHTFDKWYVDSDLTIIFNVTTKIDNDLTLYASWTKNKVEPEIKDFNVTLSNKEVTYDENSHSILLDGNIPDNTTISYIGNDQTNVGTYEVSVTLTKDGYKTLVLKATLVIKAKEFANVTLAKKEVTYDENSHSILISGNIPEGTVVTYTGNDKTNAGIYNVSVTLSKANYKTLTLSAVLTIKKQVITELSLSDLTTVYNKDIQTLSVTGDNIDLYSITYTNNNHSDAGNYLVRAVITRNNYEVLELSANLVINKADLLIEIEPSQKYKYNEAAQEFILKNISTDIDVVIKYYLDGVLVISPTEVGTYDVVLVFSNINYNELILESKLVIVTSLVDMAKDVVGKLLDIPDPWEFLPDSFNKENRITTNTDYNYSSFVNISDMNQLGIGSQLNVLYETLLNSEKYLGVLNTILKSSGVIIDTYQEHINNNPEDFNEYSSNVADGSNNFSYYILIQEDTYIFKTSLLGFSIDIRFDNITDEVSAVVAIPLIGTMKYVSSEKGLQFGLQIAGLLTNYIEFEKELDIVTGHLFSNKFIPVLNKELKTTSVIKIDATYMQVAGSNGDFFTGSKGKQVEVYNNLTGKLVGIEVEETIGAVGVEVQYDTIWYNMWDIGGISSVKELDGEIYVNGSSNPFKSKAVGGLSLKRLSRRFDIEYKDFIFYEYDETETKYIAKTVKVPMLFVQQEYVASYKTEVYEQNNKNGITSTLTNKIITTASNSINDAFANLLPVYDLKVDDNDKVLIEAFLEIDSEQ